MKKAMMATTAISLTTFASAARPELEVSIHLSNASEAERSIIGEVRGILLQIINSSEFKDQILNHTSQGEERFENNKGMSNLEIYEAFLEGREEQDGSADGKMDLEIVYYYSLSSTVGYTYPHTRKIYVNRRFYNYYSACEIAGNLYHEWTHKLGFEHDSKYTKSRDYSVPYATGRIIRELCLTR